MDADVGLAIFATIWLKIDLNWVDVCETRCRNLAGECVGPVIVKVKLPYP
jgi:hypothetical protein